MKEKLKNNKTAEGEELPDDVTEQLTGGCFLEYHYRDVDEAIKKAARTKARFRAQHGIVEEDEED